MLSPAWAQMLCREDPGKERCWKDLAGMGAAGVEGTQRCPDSSSPRALPAVDVEEHLPEPHSAEGKGSWRLWSSPSSQGNPTPCPIPQHPALFALLSSCLIFNTVLMTSAEILSKYCGTGLLIEGKSEPEINLFRSEKSPTRLFSLFQCHISCHATRVASDYYLH